MCYNITSTVMKGCCHCIMNTQQCLNAHLNQINVETVRKKSIKKNINFHTYNASFRYLHDFIYIATRSCVNVK